MSHSFTVQAKLAIAAAFQFIASSGLTKEQQSALMKCRRFVPYEFNFEEVDPVSKPLPKSLVYEFIDGSQRRLRCIYANGKTFVVRESIDSQGKTSRIENLTGIIRGDFITVMPVLMALSKS